MMRVKYKVDIILIVVNNRLFFLATNLLYFHFILEYMKSFSSRNINHPFFGWSCTNTSDESTTSAAPCRSFSVNQHIISLGKGRAVFDKASTLLNNFVNVNALGWIEVHAHQTSKSMSLRDLRPGDALCTLARCFGVVWVLNPCRVIAADYHQCQGGRRGQVTQIAFSTLNGHLLAGEERFRVIRCEQTDEVTFDMFSFSRPANLFGLIALPYVRWVQGRFFAEQAVMMRTKI